MERALDNLRAAGALSAADCASIGLSKNSVPVEPSGFPTRKAPALKAFVAMLDEDSSSSLERCRTAHGGSAPAVCWSYHVGPEQVRTFSI